LDAILANNQHEATIAGLDILNKLIANIFKDPQNDKFRVLKKSNKAIQSKLMNLKPQEKVLELLLALGYTEMDEDVSAFVGEYYTGLMAGAK